jgi:pimeloyl-ACP methyl ester carboxylesterase
MKLSFRKTGTGFPLILIHGFPMNQHVWTDLAHSLSKDFTVYTFDLPGFGESPLLSVSFSIDQVAAAVLEGLNQQKIEKAFILGHSLGGYVTLAMMENDPKRFPGAILLHSTAYADNEEKKQSRNKVLAFVDKNGVEAFTSNFIAPLFADQQHPDIERVKKISMSAAAEAVKGYSVAMRDRSDRTAVIANFPGKILLIGGEKDGGIQPSSLEKQGKLNPQAEVEIFEGVAHMAMFEVPGKTEERIRSFFQRIPVT